MTADTALASARAAAAASNVPAVPRRADAKGPALALGIADLALLEIATKSRPD